MGALLLRAWLGIPRGLPAAVSSDRTHPPWEAVEPEGRRAGAGQDEGERRSRKELRDLLLLLGVADPRAEALVDLGKILGRGGVEETAAGRLRDLGERLGVWRDGHRLHLAEEVRDLDGAVGGAEGD